jgi:hypothetical protein
MAPEQILGEALDHRVDVYAFGVILYEMVTGSNPFVGRSTIEILTNHINLHPDVPSGVRPIAAPLDHELDNLIMSCLAKDRNERPSGFRPIVAELEVIRSRTAGPPARGELPAGVAVNAGYPGRAPQRRRRWPLAAALVGGAGAGIAAAAVLLMQSAPAELGESQSPGVEVERPAMVELTLQSEPPGAEVFREGDPVPLGLTPFVMASEPDPVATRLVFKLMGHRPVTEEVALDRSSTVRVKLSRRVAKVPVRSSGRAFNGIPQKRTPRKRVRSATKNPFD